MMEVSSKRFLVGQRMIYKGDMANSPGKGAIVAIRSNPSAGRMYSVNWGAGKLEEFDSSVSYDIALDDGRQMNAVYAGNIGGEFSNKSCRFMEDDGVADEAELASLAMVVALKVAADKAKADEKAAAFAEAKAKARVAGVALGLMPVDEFGKSGRKGSAAAYNLRLELKAAGIKARVKQDGYSALRVILAAGADLDRAKEIGDKYEAGSFDGMTDCYNYAPGAWGEVFGDVRYVFVNVGD